MREEVKDRLGNSIYLTDERWEHILENHPEEVDMRISYDPEGDVLEVIFDERLHRAPQKAFRLRQGIVLYLTADCQKPVQLTLVSYRALAQLPGFECDGWQKLSTSDKAMLQPILASPVVSAFIKLNVETGFGQIAVSGVPDIFAVAA